MKNKLIINADDFGISHEVNEAITLCLNKNYINQTTIMVNMPYVDEAVELSKDNGFSDRVGLHLNLVEGKPLTERIRDTIFCDEHGMFISRIMKTPKYRMRLDKKTSECVCYEIEAQIKAFLDLGIGRKHLDSHQHSHVNPSIKGILMPIMEKYDFDDIRLSRNIPSNEMSIFKRIIKHRINKKILRYNYEHSSLTPLAFGSMRDISISSSLPDVSEMMIHPIMENGCIKEAFSDGSIESWWSEHQKNYVLI